MERMYLKGSLSSSALKTFKISSKDIECIKKLTFAGLLQEFGVGFDKVSFYLPDLLRINSKNNFRLDDIERVRDYITYQINKKYFQYCVRNNVEISEIITIPEHLINRLKTVLSYRSKHKTLREIDNIINKYLGSDGVVYTRCYYKALKNSLNDINKSKDPSMLIRDCIKKNISINKSKKLCFDKSLITNSTMEKKKIIAISIFKTINGKYTDRYKMWENYILKRKNLNQTFSLFKTLVEILPKQYWARPSFIVDDFLCWNFGGKFESIEYFDGENNCITISKTSKICDIMHEYIHSMLLKNWEKGNGKLNETICDFLFEITKGEKVRVLMIGDLVCYKYKPISKLKVNEDPYMTKLYKGKEIYDSMYEILSMLIGRIFEGICIENCYTENAGRYSAQTMDIISENFRNMCSYEKEFAALVLAFFRGEL